MLVLPSISCLITYSTIKLTCEIKYKTFPSLPADDCSQELSNDSGDEFMSRIKSASSTHCLLRPRSMRGIDRSPSGATNQTFNFDMNSTETSMGRSKIVSFNLHLYHMKVFNFTCPNFFPTSHVLTLQSEINRQKSPMLNRRRASITTLARTVPNIVPQSPGATSPVQSPTDMYRYMKNDDSHRQRNDCSR